MIRTHNISLKLPLIGVSIVSVPTVYHTVLTWSMF